MALEVPGWLFLPTVTAVEMLVSRMLSNAAQYDETLKDESDRTLPMTYAERVDWLSARPDSLLTSEEVTRREDDAMLAALGMNPTQIRKIVASRGNG